MKTICTYAALLVLTLFLSSCQKEKSGLVDSSVQMPLLSPASVSPALVNLDLTADNVSRSGSLYRIRLAVSGYALRQGGPAIARIAFRVTAPGSSSQNSTGTFSTSISDDTARFIDSITVTTDHNGVGKYLVNIWAVNASGQPSATVQQSFFVTRFNSKPRVSGLVAPDTLRIPAHGFNTYLFTVAAADSDGYADLESVGFRIIAPSLSGTVPMFDDGNTRAERDHTLAPDGDKIQGDGIFSVIVKIDSTNTVGPRTLLFQAKDRSGIYSDSLTHRITIVR